jgi:hypothetical protein
VIARELAMRLQGNRATLLRRLAGGGELQHDLPPIADPRETLASSIGALGLFSVLIVALTAGSLIGDGYRWSDLVVLLVLQVLTVVGIWRIPWRAAPEVWLLAAIGLQVLFVASLVTITGGSTSPYFVLYAPALALAGWHLRMKTLTVALGLVVATELWRAYVLGLAADLTTLAIWLPVFGLVAMLASLTSRRATASAVRSRLDQVRTAATLHAVRVLADRDPSDPTDSVAALAADTMEADAWLDIGEEPGHEQTCAFGRSQHVSVPVRDVGELQLCRAQAFSTTERRLAAILAESISRSMVSRR